MTRCPHCPVPEGHLCASESHPRYCELARDDPRYLAVIRRKSGASPFPRAFGAGDGRIRLGLACPVLMQGGAEAWQLALARWVDPEKFAWAGCAVGHGEAGIDPAMRAATAAFMPVSAAPGSVRALAGGCDILISWAIPDLAAILDGLHRRPGVVVACHAPGETAWGHKSFGNPEGVDRFVAVSELALEAIPGATRALVPTSVIWNCADTGRLAVGRDRAAMRRAWGVPEGAPVAGFLGRLSAEKRPDMMARLAARLPDPWHVVVVGAGAEHAATLAAKETAGLDRLHVVGADPAAGDVLNSFDVLVVPSDYESFGLTLAEGLWMGLPVVSTPVGLARIVPGLTTPIPLGADGPAMAAAVLAAHEARGAPSPALESIRPRLSEARFGEEWGALLGTMADRLLTRVNTPRPPAPAVDPAARDRVNACPDRGGVLPISMQREGCRCGELSECRAGKGKVPGRVTLRDCLACCAG